MAKQRKRKKRTGVMSQMQRPSELVSGEATIKQLLSGEVALNPRTQDTLKIVWASMMATSEGDLIEEARDYGYPLKKIVGFYLSEYEGYDPADFADIDDPYLDGSDFEAGTRQNIEYLKSVQTWDDFQIVIDGLKEPLEDDEPILAPPEMLSFLLDKRMIHALDDLLKDDVADMDEKTVIAFLAAEHIRIAKGFAIETTARILELSADAYRAWIASLQDRVDSDEKMSRDLKMIDRCNRIKHIRS